MRVLAVLVSALFLASCGADGEPVQPSANANVTLTPNGLALGTNLHVGQGPFSLNLGVAL